ncbi:MAG: tail fiber protein [Terracidiphilus sp.]|jgi:microcystin-dependent protein
MSDQFLGEIRLVGFNFAPIQWALAAGQMLAISQYTALFSLLGPTYGGNGVSTFALPNLQGNVALDVGQGPGLSDYVLGETGGTTAVTLLDGETPLHTHQFLADSRSGDLPNPSGNALAATASGSNIYYTGSGGTKATLNPNFLTPFAGGGLPHNNMMPYLVLNWVIALQGIFPARS